MKRLSNLLWNILLGVSFLLVSPTIALAMDPLTEQLKQFEPLPVVTPTWGWPNRIVNDPDLCREMSRVLRCASEKLRWASAARIQKLVNSEPETIAFNWSPYRTKFDRYPRWTKAEVCGPWTEKDAKYATFFREKCVAAKTVTGDIPIIVILDFEVTHIDGDWADSGCGDISNNKGLGDKLNILYRIAKEVFGGDVLWYNQGQWTPGWGAATDPRRQSPVPLNTHGDIVNFSLYYNINSTRTMETLRATADRTEQPMAAWVSVGGVYELRPWRGNGNRSPDVTFVPQLGETWWAGYWLYDSFPRKFPDKFGPVNRLKYIIWWPEPLRLGDEHFLEFIRGALAIRR